MSAPTPLDLAARVRELEREVAALRARVAALEQSLNPNVEHPLDREVVREKSVYDWQGPH